MNNNRGNNRRRGRGNNRQQGGGQQVNRIDSRARGNAPQLLEKYRKLAHDAHLNGDRVTEEYFLQFADHYFRVLADQRTRQEEQRQRRDERWQDGGENEQREDGGDYASEYGAENDYTSYDQPHRREREERAPRQDDRGERPDRAERAARAPRVEEQPHTGGEEGPEQGPEQGHVYEPVENPFVRENRGTRGLKPRREGREERRPRGRPRATEVETEANGAAEPPLGFDAAVLPPAISTLREEAPEAGTEEAKPRRRTRRPRPPADDAGETLEVIN